MLIMLDRLASSLALRKVFELESIITFLKGEYKIYIFL